MVGGNDVPELTNWDIRESLPSLALAAKSQTNLYMVTRVNIIESTMSSRLRDIVRLNHLESLLAQL